jgi:hypothetical protein
MNERADAAFISVAGCNQQAIGAVFSRMNGEAGK